MTEHRIDAGACDVFVRERGVGPAVVFGHSLGFDGDMWDAQSDALSSRHRCCAIDFRGHGRSGSPSDAFSLNDLADDVVRAMDALGIERAAYCGLSLGGMVGMRLALRHPGRVGALVVMNTSAEREDPARLAAFEAFNEQMRGHDAQPQAIEMMMSLMFSSAFRAEQPGVAERYRAKLDHPHHDGAYFASKAVLDRADILADIAAISIPVLVIGATDDTAVPPVHARAIAAAIPGASLTMIEQCGHMSAVERPRIVTDAIARHLRGDQ